MFAETRQGIDTSIRASNPDVSRGSAGALFVNGDDPEYALVYLVRPFPIGVFVEHAELKLRLKKAGWSGGPHTITVRRITSKWKEKVHYEDAPSVDSLTVEKIVTDGVDDEDCFIDVTPLMADVAEGDPYFGFRLEVDTAGIKKFHSSETGDPNWRSPKLEVTYSEFPEFPYDLLPEGERAVPTVTPHLTWNFGETQTDSWVRVFDEATEALVWESGWVPNTENSYDVPAATLAFDGAYAWDVRARAESGQESGFSDPASFVVTAKGTLAITNPAPTGGSYDQTVVSMTPEAYYRLDSDASDIANAHDGTPVGDVTFAQPGLLVGDANDSVLVLNTAGTEGHIDLAQTLDLANKSYSIAALVQPETDSIPATQVYFASHTAKSQAQSLHMKLVSDGSIVFGTWNNDLTAPAGTFSFDDQPHHIVAVHDAALGTSKIYLDGIEVASDTKMDFAGVGATSWIGAWPRDGGFDFFRGSIDELSVHYSALSPTQVGELYTSATTAPGAGAMVEETTPPVTTSYTPANAESVTQMKHALERNGVEVFDSGRREFVPTDTFVIPSGNIKGDSATYRLIVRGWLDVPFEAQPGNPVYVEDFVDFIYDNSGAPAAVDSLTVTDDAHEPFVTLDWTRALLPDYFALKIDGVMVHDRIVPADVEVSLGNYRLTHWEARPGVEHTYEIEAVVSNASAVLQHSDANPVVAHTLESHAVWLVAPSLNLSVPIIGFDPSNLSIGEIGETHYGSHRKPWRITSGVYGYQGTISGILSSRFGRTGREWRDRMEIIKGLPTDDDTLRLVIGDHNYPVTIGETKLNPTGMPHIFEINFPMWQTGEFTFEAV